MSLSLAGCSTPEPQRLKKPDHRQWKDKSVERQERRWLLIAVVAVRQDLTQAAVRWRGTRSAEMLFVLPNQQCQQETNTKLTNITIYKQYYYCSNTINGQYSFYKKQCKAEVSEHTAIQCRFDQVQRVQHRSAENTATHRDSADQHSSHSGLLYTRLLLTTTQTNTALTQGYYTLVRY